MVLHVFKHYVQKCTDTLEGCLAGPFVTVITVTTVFMLLYPKEP